MRDDCRALYKYLDNLAGGKIIIGRLVWLFPRAGAGTVNTYDYSLMQVMFTPKNISAKQPDLTDWPYSGGLTLSHGLHSFDPVRQFSLETELTAGVMGPASLAQQTQTWFHGIIGYTKPEGWAHQFPNDVLLNISMQAEKMIWTHGSAFELMGGGQVEAGKEASLRAGAPTIPVSRVGGKGRGRADAVFPVIYCYCAISIVAL